MAYEGSFEQCLTIAAQRLHEDRKALIVIWQEKEDGIWKCKACSQEKVICCGDVTTGIWRYMTLDYELMRSLLIWIAQNVLKGAN